MSSLENKVKKEIDEMIRYLLDSSYMRDFVVYSTDRRYDHFFEVMDVLCNVKVKHKRLFFNLNEYIDRYFRIKYPLEKKMNLRRNSSDISVISTSYIVLTYTENLLERETYMCIAYLYASVKRDLSLFTSFLEKYKDYFNQEESNVGSEEDDQYLDGGNEANVY